MGANFALRMANLHSSDPVPRLGMVTVENPALDPFRATVNIDRIGLIRRYFLNKWKRSLRKKQELFPAVYDFSSELTMETCMDITESLIGRLTEFGMHALFQRVHPQRRMARQHRNPDGSHVEGRPLHSGR